ncbi:SAM-dependent methyltransferase [Streptomyces tateyamensis]|uniref:SAM-dependent methyltransferase n=1 Tax=Streptomyces tateyamensis TaxID=565073 RepID=A0A2V4NJ65_9ACTN|nr:class I SAM-dependent methyltransferase [Streptomyces tateyamensis]PYC80525.1 SAM-dependent methyltransferase [Streptomyces tateyamensis]
MTATAAPGYAFAEAADLSEAQMRALSEAFDPFTTERLAGTGLAPGWRCLEIGAGGGTVANWLAPRVLPGGEVLATDVDTRRIRPVAGVRVLRHDIVHDPLPEGEFDLIHARLVLQHLPERLAVLDRLLGALRPGGWLQLDEFDVSYGPVLLAPSADAAELYEEYLAAKARALEVSGARAVWGRECAADLLAAGYDRIDPQPQVALWRSGHPGLALQLSHFDMLRERLLAQGLTDEQLERLRALLRDPQFAICSPVLYSVQARRPGQPAARNGAAACDC